MVDPRFERVVVAPEFLDSEFTALTVFAYYQHRRFVPLLLAFPAVEQDAGDHRLVFGKYVGLDYEALPRNGLRGKATTVDFRPHALDDNALWELPWRGPGRPR